MIGYTWFKFVLHAIIGSIAPFSLENPSQLFRGAFLRLSASDFLSSSLFDFSIRFDWLSLFPNRLSSSPVVPKSHPCNSSHSKLLLLSSLGSVHPPFCDVTSLSLFLGPLSLSLLGSLYLCTTAGGALVYSMPLPVNQTKSHSPPWPFLLTFGIHPLLVEWGWPGWLVCRQRQTVC